MKKRSAAGGSGTQSDEDPLHAGFTGSAALGRLTARFGIAALNPRFIRRFLGQTQRLETRRFGVAGRTLFFDLLVDCRVALLGRAEDRFGPSPRLGFLLIVFSHYRTFFSNDASLWQPLETEARGMPQGSLSLSKFQVET